MKQYKAFKILDIEEKPRWVIEDENGNIINKNPKKEELKVLRKKPYINKNKYDDEYLKRCLIQFYEGNGRTPIQSDLQNNPKYPSYYTYWRAFGSLNNALRETRLLEKRYNQTNTCDKCGEKLMSGKALMEYDENRNWTGKWLCKKCYMKDYNKRPESYNNARKLVADCRTGNLDPYSNHGKKFIFEMLTCKVHDVKNLNIENDNYESSIDHSPDISGNILQTKGALYNSIDKWWYQNWKNEHNKIFDKLILYCTNEKLTIIIRVYIFPKEEVLKRTSVAILDDNKKHWYDKYRVDEKLYDDMLRNLTVGDFPQFDKKKLMEWLGFVRNR